MAVLSSHFLNGVDGSHAGGVAVKLVHIDDAGARETVFVSASDAGGRFAEEVKTHPAGRYEMVIESGSYFQQFSLPQDGKQILTEIVIRFTMPDQDARYHIPVIMAPHSYSCWWSQ